MKRFVDRCDSLVYAAEKVFCVAALMVMSISVFCDVAARVATSQPSKFFTTIRDVASWGGLTLVAGGTAENVVNVLVALAAAAALALALLGFSRKRSWSKIRFVSIWLLGCAIVAGMWSALAVVPSHWVLSLLIVSGAVAIGIYQIRRGTTPAWVVSWFLFCLALMLGVWQMPSGYIWSLELSMILLIWIGIVGASLATYERRHIRVDALDKVMPERHRAKIAVVRAWVNFLFCAFLFSVAISYVFGENGDFHNPARFQVTELPRWTGTLSVVVGLGVIGLRFFKHAVWRDIEPPTGDGESS